MKLRYIALAAVVLATLVSCTREEKDLFDKSASERAAEAVTNAQSVLTSTQYGWEMVYFPNTENMSTSKGYVLILSFSEDGSVSVSAKNSVTTANKIKTDVSTWKVLSDYGPLLSFDTYNEVLHAWSDPQTDGDGYLGDYEFLILKATPELIILKGKKHGAYSVLRPMKTADMASHFAACEDMHNKLFANENIVVVNQNGNRYYLYNGLNGIFYQADYGKELIMETALYYPICATADGIVMCYGFDKKNEGVNTEHMFAYTGQNLSGEYGTVLSAADKVDYMSDYMVLQGNQWNIKVDEVSPVLDAAIETLETKLKSLSANAKKNAAVKGLNLRYLSGEKKFVVSVRYTLEQKTKEQTPVSYTFDVRFDKDQSGVTLNYVEPADENAKKILDKVPEFETLVKSLDGVYKIGEMTESINPTLGCKLEGQANPDLWLEITGSKPQSK